MRLVRETESEEERELERRVEYFDIETRRAHRVAALAGVGVGVAIVGFVVALVTFLVP